MKILKVILSILAILLPLQGILLGFARNRLGMPLGFTFWKEILVILAIVVGFWFFLQDQFQNKKLNFNIFFQANRLRNLASTKPLIFITICLLVFVNCWSIFISFWQGIPLTTLIIGFRFELWWLNFFGLGFLFNSYFNRIQGLEVVLNKSILIGFLGVTIINFLSLVFGHVEFLSWLGLESQEVGSNLQSEIYLCHSIDFGVEGCRLTGGLASPNHLAGYLLLIWPILLKAIFETKKASIKILWIIANLFWFLQIYLTFSRYAWLVTATALAIFAFIGVISFLKNSIKLHTYWKKLQLSVIISFLCLPLFVGLVLINLNLEGLSFLPVSLTKPSSTLEHRRQTGASFEVLTNSKEKFWIGFGLGSSGPAAKRQYQDLDNNPIIQEHGLTAFKWYLNPAPDRLTIPENWYLQTWLNGGLFYFLAYLFLTCIPLIIIFSNYLRNNSNLELVFFISFYGIIVGNLFLHIWENQTLALYWTLIWIAYKNNFLKAN